jgi:hypothetical protein
MRRIGNGPRIGDKAAGGQRGSHKLGNNYIAHGARRKVKNDKEQVITAISPNKRLCKR